MAAYVYILASKTDGAIYIGVTSDLVKRIWQHKNEKMRGHTRLYQIKRLVYFEEYDHIESATLREKQLKKWNRQWKINLIVRDNPGRVDLYPGLIEHNLRFPPARE
jgi:putative endonuclease